MVIKMQNKISVIIPAYNSEKTISKCIESIINQTYKNLEIVIVNDGSLDNTLKIINSYAKKDKRINIINNENHGVSYSRNFGINIASGDYITFVDADDYLDSQCFEELNKLINPNIDFIRYNFKSNKKTFSNDLYDLNEAIVDFTTDKKKSVYSHFFTSDKPIPNLVFLLLIKASIAKKISFNEKLYMMEDVDFYIQLFQKSKKALFTNKKYYNYYVNPTSVTQNPKNCVRNIKGILDTNKSISKRISILNDKKFNDEVNTNHYRVICNIIIRMPNYNYFSYKEIVSIYKLSEFKNLEKMVDPNYLKLKNKILFYLSKCHMYLMCILFSKIVFKLRDYDKKKKYNIAILTINDNNNYGNRLQNYALQQYLTNTFGANVETIWNNLDLSFLKRLFRKSKKYLKFLLRKNGYIRYFNFTSFTKKIKHSRYVINNKFVPKKINTKYDFFITGSDQVWNPNHKRLTKNDLLSFANPDKRISYAASFGVSDIEEKYTELLKHELSKFRAISVRENEAKSLIENKTKIKNVEVLIDPTMLLDSEQWKLVEKKPKYLKSEKYILCYFLGKIDNDSFNKIKKISKEKGWEIINILDPKSIFYNCGPSEFLYLERNAQLICTDSYHSSVFAIIFNTPLTIFERKDKHVSMNSRIETLVEKFDLDERLYSKSKKINLDSFDRSKLENIINNEKLKTYNYFYKFFKK